MIRIIRRWATWTVAGLLAFVATGAAVAGNPDTWKRTIQETFQVSRSTRPSLSAFTAEQARCKAWIDAMPEQELRYFGNWVFGVTGSLTPGVNIDRKDLANLYLVQTLLHIRIGELDAVSQPPASWPEQRVPAWNEPGGGLFGTGVYHQPDDYAPTLVTPQWSTDPDPEPYRTGVYHQPDDYAPTLVTPQWSSDPDPTPYRTGVYHQPDDYAPTLITRP